MKHTFGLTKEDLEKAEKKLPIYSIMDTLTPEQKNKTIGGHISQKYLTLKQIEAIEEAISFDEELQNMVDQNKVKVNSITASII